MIFQTEEAKDMHKRYQIAATAASVLLGSTLMVSMPVFAAGQPTPPPPKQQQVNPTNFQLKSLSLLSQLPTNQVEFSVTVEQTSPDGSDFGTSNTEFHAFPNTIYVSFNDGKSYDRATISAADQDTGLTYTKSGTTPVSATADYSVSLPSGLTPGNSYTLEIYQPQSYTGPQPSSSDQKYAFRMGPAQDGSWADDLVWMQDFSSWPTFSPSPIPTGQLPEVPYAGWLPAVAVLSAAVGIWAIKRRSV